MINKQFTEVKFMERFIVESFKVGKQTWYSVTDTKTGMLIGDYSCKHIAMSMAEKMKRKVERGLYK